MSHPYALEIRKGRWSSAFFDTVGNETGDTCLSDANGSDAPVDFKITAPADRYLYIHQFTGMMRACKPLTTQGFAGDGPLTNGLLLMEITADGTERVMTNQLPIRCNMDFGAYSPWTTLPNRNTLLWRFQITDDGTPYRLCPRCALVWRVRDDLTAKNLGLVCLHMRAGMIRLPVMYK